MGMEKGILLEGDFIKDNIEDKKTLSKDEFRGVLKDAEISEIYEKTLSKKEIGRIANELYNDREGKSAEDIKDEIFEKLKKAEREVILKDFGLESIIKVYMKELSGAVKDDEELEKIREEVVEELFSKYNEDLYNSARINNNANNLGKDLGSLFRDRLEDVKKAA